MSELYPEGSGKQDNFFAAFSDAMAKNIKNMRGNRIAAMSFPMFAKPMTEQIPMTKNSDERNTESK